MNILNISVICGSKKNLKPSQHVRHLNSKHPDQKIIAVNLIHLQTWRLTTNNIEKIMKTQRSKERTMLKISLRDRKIKL